MFNTSRYNSRQYNGFFIDSLLDIVPAAVSIPIIINDLQTIVMGTNPIIVEF